MDLYTADLEELYMLVTDTIEELLPDASPEGEFGVDVLATELTKWDEVIFHLKVFRFCHFRDSSVKFSITLSSNTREINGRFDEEHIIEKVKHTFSNEVSSQDWM